MRPVLLTLVAAGAVLSAAAQAAAPSRAMLAGSEVRRDYTNGAWHRYEVLQLKADGTFSGNYENSRPVTRGSFYRLSGAISGRWSLDGDVLCFEDSGLEYHGRNCYKLTKGGYSAQEYVGTHAGNGDVWRFFVYPRAGR